MNDKQAKKLRKYVKNFGAYSTERMYKTLKTGQVVLMNTCKRYYYQYVKKGKGEV